MNIVKSSTHLEADDGGHYVTIQHCEVLKKDGTVCDDFLGVNYPTEFCRNHDVVYSLTVDSRNNGLVLEGLSETARSLISLLSDYSDNSMFQMAQIREVAKRR